MRIKPNPNIDIESLLLIFSEGTKKYGIKPLKKLIRKWSRDNIHPLTKVFQAVYSQQANLRYASLLAFMFHYGIGTPKNPRAAFYNYNKYANILNDAFTQKQLALCYQYGHGTTPDNLVALKYYEKSAQNGNVLGQSFLGYYYSVGKDVVPDRRKGFLWYKYAAENGYLPAQYNTYFCYRWGKGVEKDIHSAMRYARLAKISYHIVIADLKKLFRKR